MGLNLYLARRNLFFTLVGSSVPLWHYPNKIEEELTRLLFKEDVD